MDKKENKKKKIVLSQSMMKDYAKMCGLLFKGKYVDKNVRDEPSEAMKEGIYFEYLCTGQMPKSGVVPQPERTNKGELTAAYKRIVEAVGLFKKIIKFYNIKILEVGLRIENDSMSGVLDILAEWDGRVVIIDLKYSGLIDDKWSDMGWADFALHEKDQLMKQPVHYKILVNDELNVEDVPFYFFVFNSKDPTDMKIFLIEVDPDRYFFHQVEMDKVREGIEKSMIAGWKAKPDYRICKDCPLSDTCKEKEEMPSPRLISF